MHPIEHLMEASVDVGRIRDPRRRAGVERWLLEFAAVNVQYNAIQAMVVAEQLAHRYGYWAIVDERSWDRLCRVPLRTEFEWSLTSVWPADFARPLILPGSHGAELQLFLPEDVPGAPMDERLRPVAHREVVPPEFPVPDFEDFADHVGERERAMFGKLVEVGGLVRWDIDLLAEEHYLLDFYEAELRSVDHEAVHFFLSLNPLAPVIDVMGMVLRMTAELVLLYALGRFDEDDLAELDWAECASPLEIDLMVWLAARRLRLDVRTGSVVAAWLMDPEAPAPADLRWTLVFEVADGIEGVLLGHRYQVND